MTRVQKAVVYVCACALLTALVVAQQKATTSADEKAIRTADADWSKAASNRDLEKTVSFYADDAVAMNPGVPATRGKQAIHALWTDEFKDPATKVSWRAEAVAASGDLGYSRGAYDAVYTADGKPVRERGKYLAVWRKQNGTWKVVADMYNPDGPAVPVKK